MLAGPAGAAFPGENGRIVFESDRTTGPGVDNPEGDDEIFTVEPDGTGLSQVTFNGSDDFDPAFSPDGQKIAYLGGFETKSGFVEGIYKMKTAGSGKTRIIKNESGSYYRGLDWAPVP